MRSQYVLRARDVAEKLALEFPGINPEAWGDHAKMAADPVARELAGDKDTMYPQILFAEGLAQTREGFLKRPLLPKVRPNHSHLCGHSNGYSAPSRWVLRTRIHQRQKA